jgi:hypothetical protein
MALFCVKLALACCVYQVAVQERRVLQRSAVRRVDGEHHANPAQGPLDRRRVRPNLRAVRVRACTRSAAWLRKRCCKRSAAQPPSSTHPLRAQSVLRGRRCGMKSRRCDLFPRRVVVPRCSPANHITPDRHGRCHAQRVPVARKEHWRLRRPHAHTAHRFQTSRACRAAVNTPACRPGPR